MTTCEVNDPLTSHLPRILNHVVEKVENRKTQMTQFAARSFDTLKTIPGYLIMLPIALVVGSMMVASGLMSLRGN